MLKKESSYILSLEGKDILARQDNKNWKVSKYKGALDYSLLALKLDKISNGEAFTYNEKEKKQYCDSIINVTFRYTVKNGNKVISNKKQIREKLYTNGFNYNGKHWVRFLRSAGKAKNGHVLFIEDTYYQPMADWLNMGIDFEDKVSLAEVEAYKSLVSSSIINTLKIKPENILLVDDLHSTFKDTVMAVRVNEKGELKATEEEIEINNNLTDGEGLIDKSLMGEYADKGFILLRNRWSKVACFNTNISDYLIDKMGITSIEELNGKTVAKDVKDIKVILTPSSIKALKYCSWEHYISNVESDWGIVKYEKPTAFGDNGSHVQTNYQLLNTLQMSKDEVKSLLQPSFEYYKLLKTNLEVFKHHIRCEMKESNEDAKLGFNSSRDWIYSMLNLAPQAFSQTDVFGDFRNDTCSSYADNLKKGRILVEGNYSVMCSAPFELLQSTVKKIKPKDRVHPLQGNKIYTTRFTLGTEVLGCRSPHICNGNVYLTEVAGSEELDGWFNFTNEIVVVNADGQNIMNRLSGCDWDSDTILLTNDSILINAAKKNYNKYIVPVCLVEGKKKKVEQNAENLCELDVKCSVNKIGEICNLAQLLNSLLWHRLNNGTKDVDEIYKTIVVLDVLSGMEIDSCKREPGVYVEKELKRIKQKYSDIFLPQFFEKVKFSSKPNKKESEEKRAERQAKKEKEKAKFKHYDTAMDYLLEEVKAQVKDIGIKIRTPWKPLTTMISKNIKISDANYKQKDIILKSVSHLKKQCGEIWSDKNLSDAEKTLECANFKKQEINKWRYSVDAATIKSIIFDCYKNKKDKSKLSRQKQKAEKQGIELAFTKEQEAIENFSKIKRKVLSILWSSNRNAFIDALQVEKESNIKMLRRCDYCEKNIEIYGIPYKIS